MNAVIYARYSSDSQREESIEGQLRECREYAERNNMTIVGTYIDRALSAKTADRPEFQHMIKDSAKELFEIVLVWKLDRFSRDRYDSAHYKHILKKNGVKVISAKEHISEGPEGIILEAMLEGYAEFYSAELSEKIHRGQKENALKGKNNGGGVPLGYLLDKKAQKLATDPTTAPLVVEVFEKYADGKSIRSIVEDFNARGLKTKRGQPFNINSFSSLLKNRKYIGEYRYQDVVIEGGVPAIVPEDLFNRVQERMEKNRHAPAMAKAKEDYLLTTKLFCGKCERMMVGESGKSHTGAMHYYYKCSGAKRLKDCDKKAVRKDWIERVVVRLTMQRVMDEEKINRLIDAILVMQEQEDTTTPALRSQLAETESSIGNILKAIEQGIFTPSTKQRLDELEARKEEILANIQTAELQKPKLTREQMTAWFEQFRHGDPANREFQKRLIDTFVNAVYVFDDKLVLTYNYQHGTQTISLDEIESALSSDFDGATPPNQKSEPLSEGTEVRIFLFSERFGILKGGAAVIFDYERRIQALEARVQALEDALKKERAAQVPDAQTQEKVTAQSSPAPAVQTPEKASEQSLAAAAETREKTPEQSPAQQTVSAQLRAALDAPADPSCFHYVPEPGTATNGLSLYGAEHPKPERALQKLVGKGLRITAYTGFDAERVVIPAKIGGLPVVSIGEKVFKNTTVSEVILPESIKAILREAFSGCKRLQHIDLPDGLEYLGSHCFAGSGLTALHFPDRLKTIPEGCCGGCANLSDATFGQQVQTIQGSAFHVCKKLQTVSFPESLLRVDNDAFEKTAITRFIFPAGVQEVGDVKHSRFYIEPRYPAFDRTTSDSPVLVFLGMDAVLKIIDHTHIALIYCLPGSKVQQIARDKGIPVRPLSEFQMEDA